MRVAWLRVFIALGALLLCAENISANVNNVSENKEDLMPSKMQEDMGMEGMNEKDSMPKDEMALMDADAEKDVHDDDSMKNNLPMADDSEGVNAKKVNEKLAIMPADETEDDAKSADEKDAEILAQPGMRRLARYLRNFHGRQIFRANAEAIAAAAQKSSSVSDDDEDAIAEERAVRRRKRVRRRNTKNKVKRRHNNRHVANRRKTSRRRLNNRSSLRRKNVNRATSRRKLNRKNSRIHRNQPVRRSSPRRTTSRKGSRKGPSRKSSKPKRKSKKSKKTKKQKRKRKNRKNKKQQKRKRQDDTSSPRKDENYNEPMDPHEEPQNAGEAQAA